MEKGQNSKGEKNFFSDSRWRRGGKVTPPFHQAPRSIRGIWSHATWSFLQKKKHPVYCISQTHETSTLLSLRVFERERGGGERERVKSLVFKSYKQQCDASDWPTSVRLTEEDSIVKRKFWSTGLFHVCYTSKRLFQRWFVSYLLK